MPRHPRPSRFKALAGSLILLSSLVGPLACAHRGFIAGTTVVDTPENQQLYHLIGRVRQAMQERDAAALLALVSTRYFEDNGTVDPRDDYGYVELKEKLLAESMDTAKEMYVSFDVHEIVVKDDYAYADVRYSARARLDLPAGRLWDTHGDFDRLEFAREAGEWKIISGL